jgi:hypothetical protein
MFNVGAGVGQASNEVGRFRLEDSVVTQEAEERETASVRF